MSLGIQDADIFDFNVVPNPRGIISPEREVSLGSPCVFHHPAVGALQFGNLALPHMHVLSMEWSMDREDLVLYGNKGAEDSININFQTGGHLDTSFRGLARATDMLPMTHNLVYAPDPDYVNRVARNQDLSMFHVSLDKRFFASVLEDGDAFSERMLERLHTGLPFSASPRPQHITPRMAQLIQGIIRCNETGPMRSLLVQSRTLELLALEMEQFRTVPPASAAVRPDDAEKLYRLKRYLEGHYLEELSLDGLSRMFLLNEFKVKKGFRELFGTTVFHHVKKLRMEHAVLMLRDGGANVSETAFALGYAHDHHFSVAFRKYFGISPSRFARDKAFPAS